MSRRDFLKTSAAGAFVLAAGSEKADADTRSPLSTFNYSDVKLLDGPLKRQYDRTHAFFLNLDEDRLLKIYRQRAGLAAPGDDMGGWYDADGYVPGGTLGQYISGLARFGSATSDPATKAKVARLIKGFAETIASNGDPYASEVVTHRCPGYVMDKHAVGLLDATRLLRVPGCLDILRHAWSYVIKQLPAHAVEVEDPEINGEPDELYTLPENLYYAYEVSGEEHYRELARRFLFDDRYFDPLARGENALTGKHAYSHVNALGSAARAYLVDNNPKYLRAIQNAFDLIEAQEYASGGYGPDETFVEPNSDKLFEKLTSTGNHFETPCCTYAHFKLSRYLIRITGESRYGDGMERILYNTILGAKDIQEDGRTFYYADYRTSTTKRYFHSAWPCCSGTYPQIIADYVISAYFRDRAGIYINFYIPSELAWQRNGEAIRLIQETAYPLGDRSTITLRMSTPQEFTISLRIPDWVQQPVKINVNGKNQDVDAKPRMFASLQRRWKDQDRVEIQFPMPLRTVPVNQHHPKTVALMRGPLMYVTSNPWFKLPAPHDLDQLTPVPFARNPGWFELPGVRSRDARAFFMPYYTVQDETYNTYIQQLLGARRHA
jgi:hypothetical protein